MLLLLWAINAFFGDKDRKLWGPLSQGKTLMNIFENSSMLWKYILYDFTLLTSWHVAFCESTPTHARTHAHSYICLTCWTELCIHRGHIYVPYGAKHTHTHSRKHTCWTELYIHTHDPYISHVQAHTHSHKQYSLLPHGGTPRMENMTHLLKEWNPHPQVLKAVTLFLSSYILRCTLSWQWLIHCQGVTAATMSL